VQHTAHHGKKFLAPSLWATYFSSATEENRVVAQLSNKVTGLIQLQLLLAPVILAPSPTRRIIQGEIKQAAGFAAVG